MFGTPATFTVGFGYRRSSHRRSCLPAPGYRCRWAEEQGWPRWLARAWPDRCTWRQEYCGRLDNGCGCHGDGDGRIVGTAEIVRDRQGVVEGTRVVDRGRGDVSVIGVLLHIRLPRPGDRIGRVTDDRREGGHIGVKARVEVDGPQLQITPLSMNRNSRSINVKVHVPFNGQPTSVAQGLNTGVRARSQKAAPGKQE